MIGLRLPHASLFPLSASNSCRKIRYNVGNPLNGIHEGKEGLQWLITKEWCHFIFFFPATMVTCGRISMLAWLIFWASEWSSGESEKDLYYSSHPLDFIRDYRRDGDDDDFQQANVQYVHWLLARPSSLFLLQEYTEWGHNRFPRGFYPTNDSEQSLSTNFTLAFLWFSKIITSLLKFTKNRFNLDI